MQFVLSYHLRRSTEASPMIDWSITPIGHQMSCLRLQSSGPSHSPPICHLLPLPCRHDSAPQRSTATRMASVSYSARTPLSTYVNDSSIRPAQKDSHRNLFTSYIHDIIAKSENVVLHPDSLNQGFCVAANCHCIPTK